jgi:hypothetical protein
VRSSGLRLPCISSSRRWSAAVPIKASDLAEIDSELPTSGDCGKFARTSPQLGVLTAIPVFRECVDQGEFLYDC